jgi:hypothetical protein
MFEEMMEKSQQDAVRYLFTCRLWKRLRLGGGSRPSMKTAISPGSNCPAQKTRVDIDR